LPRRSCTTLTPVAMHPPLDKPHPYCHEVIELFKACHADNPVGKWVGACNSAKRALDDCLKAQKKILARENQAKAQRQRERMAQAREISQSS